MNNSSKSPAKTKNKSNIIDALNLALKKPFGIKVECYTNEEDKEIVNLVNSIISKGNKTIFSMEKEIIKTQKYVNESDKTRGQLKESVGEILKFQKLSEVISTSHNIEQVLDALENLSLSILPIIGHGVYLYERQEKNLIPIRIKGLTKQVLEIISEQQEEGIIDWVTKERNPVMIPDIKKVLQNNSNNSENNFIIIPLIVRDRVIGIYNIYTDVKESDFTKQQLDLLAVLSNVAGVAIENSRLYEQMNRTIKELALLYETGKKVSSILNTQELYQQSINTVCEKLSVSMGWIFDINADDKLSLRAHFGCKLQEECFGPESPFYEVIERKEAKLYLESTIRKYPVLLNSQPIKNLICVPFFAQENIKGIIAIACKKDEDALNIFQLRLLRTLANQISVAVENCRLYQEILSVNQSLTDMQGQLLRSSKLASLGEFAGGVAHEVNNPLQIILGRVQMVLMDSEDMTQKKELKIIESETKRIASIVRGLLEFAKEGEREVDFETLNINAVLKDALILISHQMEALNITIEEQYCSAQEKIFGDTGMLKQVFLNICINAKQAMPNGGLFIVRSYTDKLWFYVEFIDNGVGISLQNMNKIFDPFFTTKGKGEGSGLGLSISYNIIKKHNGLISVESKEKQGTKFIVKLPLSKAHI